MLCPQHYQNLAGIPKDSDALTQTFLNHANGPHNNSVQIIEGSGFFKVNCNKTLAIKVN